MRSPENMADSSLFDAEDYDEDEFEGGPSDDEDLEREEHVSFVPPRLHSLEFSEQPALEPHCATGQGHLVGTHAENGDLVGCAPPVRVQVGGAPLLQSSVDDRPNSHGQEEDASPVEYPPPAGCQESLADVPIWKRTRAHLSLQEASLEELEAFLRVSDEEDYFQNVDDEEEYRKFLEAVMGEGGEEHVVAVGEVDDDDDDDFHLDEALQSVLPPRRRNRSRKGSSAVSRPPLRPLRPLGLPEVVIEEEAIQPRLLQMQSHGCGLVPGESVCSPEQRGQLYSLIWQHTQLLVQVHALTALEPAQQEVAGVCARLLQELLRKRTESAATGHHHLTPFPSPPFPPYWVPPGDGRVCSVVDVAPLTLLGPYSVDMGNAALALEEQLAASVARESRVPIFAGEGRVMMVPLQVAGAAHRFLGLFDPALLPRLAPHSGMAKRILFTPAEDQLLAMGVELLNSDWVGIQQRFLVPKTAHQVHVRYKNCCSGRASAPNPVQAVRTRKLAPLTSHEKQCVDYALMVLRLDWESLWRRCCPHRDPALLPSQWKEAAGGKPRRRYHPRSRIPPPRPGLASPSESEEEEVQDSVREAFLSSPPRDPSPPLPPSPPPPQPRQMTPCAPPFPRVLPKDLASLPAPPPLPTFRFLDYLPAYMQPPPATRPTPRLPLQTWEQRRKRPRSKRGDLPSEPLPPIVMPNGRVVQLKPPPTPAITRCPLLPPASKRRQGRGREENASVVAVGEGEEEEEEGVEMEQEEVPASDSDSDSNEGAIAAGVLAVHFEREEMADSEEEQEEQVAFEREVVESE